MTYGDRIGNKPQNTSSQLNADNINHTDTTQHIIIHNSSYMMAPPYGSDPTTCQRQAASIQCMRWSGEPPQRPNAYQGFLTALRGGCWHHGATAFLH